MSLQNTNLIIQGSQLPATFRGKPNDLFREMLARMRIVSPSGVSFFVTGDTEPPNNQGPWLKGGTQWWVFDPELKRYVPLDISESETLWYQVGATTPTTTTPPLWLKTTANATEASPAFGTPVAWYLFDGTTWVQLPVLIEDRSITQAKLDFKANFFGTASGTNSYTLTYVPGGVFSYGDGVSTAFFCLIKFSNANTGPATISFNGGVIAPIKKNVTQDLSAGEIAAGSVHALIFDGTNFQVISTLANVNVIPPPIGGIAFSEGLIIKNDAVTPDDIINITANAVLLQNATGNTFQASTVINDVDITLSGAGGLDTGAALSSTWYFIWLISNGSVVEGMFSLSSTTPTMPAGYTYKGLLGAIYRDSSNNFIGIYQTARSVAIVPQDTAVIANSGTGVVQTVDLSAIIPIIGVFIWGLIRSASEVIIYPTAAVPAVQKAGGISVNLSGGVIQMYFEAPIKVPQQIEVAAGGATADLRISGFKV